MIAGAGQASIFALELGFWAIFYDALVACCAGWWRRWWRRSKVIEVLVVRRVKLLVAVDRFQMPVWQVKPTAKRVSFARSFALGDGVRWRQVLAAVAELLTL